MALLIVVPWGYAFVPLLAAGTLLAGLVLVSCGSEWRQLDREDGLFCAVLLAYASVWLLDVWRTGHWPAGDGEQGLLLPLWPLLAAVLLVGFRLHPPNPPVLWWGAGFGALGAGSIALYERLVLGQARANNDMNAIPFGNLSLLLGAISLLATLSCLSQGRPRPQCLLTFSILGGLAGLLGSLLSGTRGGWIAAPFLLLVVYRAAHGLVSAGIRQRLAISAMAALLALVLLSHNGVIGRMHLAVSNIEQYWQGESRGTSVGQRLEMWRAGGTLLLERPLTGWGEGRLEVARDAVVRQEMLHPGILRHDQLHSDLIDTAARRGLLGLVVLLLLYCVPLWLFWRRLADPGTAPEVCLLASAGMMVPIAFIDFGLTQSMLRDVRGLSGYLGLCVVCWVAVRRAEAESRYQQVRTCVIKPLLGSEP